MRNLTLLISKEKLPTIMTCSSTVICKEILNQLSKEKKDFSLITPPVDFEGVRTEIEKGKSKHFLFLIYPECGNHVKDLRKNLKEFFNFLISKNKLTEVVPIIITLSDIVIEIMNEIIYLFRDKNFKVRHIHINEKNIENYIVYWNSPNTDFQQIKNIYSEEYLDIIRSIYGIK